LSTVQAEQAHQMQRVGVTGIKCERLLTAELCVQILPRPHLPKSGFIGRRRRGVGLSWFGLVLPVFHRVGSTHLPSSDQYPELFSHVI
jgi:hypothetical protein